MLDFHTHILPGIDDGAEDELESLAMLALSYKQGVHTVIFTPHFYANDSSPQTFLKKRRQGYEALIDAMQYCSFPMPQVKLGAEVAYYSGISESEDLEKLAIQGTPLVLIELPMLPLSEYVMEDIEKISENLGLIPVLAHVDRYMRNFGDYTIIEKAAERDVLVQVNSDYFINKATRKKALSNLEEGLITFIGTDAHDLDNRAPNMDEVKRICVNNGYEDFFYRLIKRNRALMTRYDDARDVKIMAAVGR